MTKHRVSLPGLVLLIAAGLFATNARPATTPTSEPAKAGASPEVPTVPWPKGLKSGDGSMLLSEYARMGEEEQVIRPISASMKARRSVAARTDIIHSTTYNLILQEANQLHLPLTFRP